MLKQFVQHLTSDGKSPKMLEGYLGNVSINGQLKTCPFDYEVKQIVMMTWFIAYLGRVPAWLLRSPVLLHSRSCIGIIKENGFRHGAHTPVSFARSLSAPPALHAEPQASLAHTKTYQFRPPKPKQIHRGSGRARVGAGRTSPKKGRGGVTALQPYLILISYEVHDFKGGLEFLFHKIINEDEKKFKNQFRYL